MKILLVGNYLPDNQVSMQRFGNVLLHELRKQGYQVRLLRPPVRQNWSILTASSSNKWLGYMDKFVWFVPRLHRAAQWADVVHILDHSNAAYVKTIAHKPHLINCHDVLAMQSALGQIPQQGTRWTGKWLQRLILNGLRRAERIVCISQKTQEELLALAPLSPAIVSVIYMGLNYAYSPMSHALASARVLALVRKVCAGDGLPDFLLHVGGNEWYKNRIGVLRIYARLRHKRGHLKTPLLIMAGKPFDEVTKRFVEENQLSDVVINLVNVADEDLRALYSLARLLLFPSLAEGFGWPIIEAQACGCPVVTSHIPPMTEVGGDAASYSDPYDEDHFADQVQNLMNENEIERQRRIESGFSNASRFSTRQMIDAYITQYQEAIAVKTVSS